MSVGIEADLYEFVRDSIRHWVGKNFGSQEVKEPSWNIDELASHLTKCLNKREHTIKQLTTFSLKIYMKEISDEARAEIMNRVFEKLDRVGGSLISITYENKTLDQSIQGEKKVISAVLSLEIPVNNRAIRGLDRWLSRQQQGHGIFLEYELMPETNIF